MSDSPLLEQGLGDTDQDLLLHGTYEEISERLLLRSQQLNFVLHRLAWAMREQPKGIKSLTFPNPYVNPQEVLDQAVDRLSSS